jgi:hypothetical protein
LTPQSLFPAPMTGTLGQFPSPSNVTLEYLHPPQRQPLTAMTTKQWTLIALAIVLGGFSLYLNRDWFAGDVIQIHSRSRPAGRGFYRRNRRPVASATEPVFFALDRKLKLTSLKVIPISDIETNKYPHPIWDLVAASNSVPIMDFAYGMRVPGMRPRVPGATPDPLVPGATYRLLIEAGRLKAEHDFVAVASTP